MTGLSFLRNGILSDDKEVLGLGCAKEEIITALSKRVKRIFATDIYMAPASWAGWHSADMLASPEKHMAPDFNRRRVVFQHVDMRDLPYEDNSFDGVYSCSSIEHIGDDSDISRALDEIVRVLKPGGVASISTEYRLKGNGNKFDNVRLVTDEDIIPMWVGERNWKLTWPLNVETCPSKDVDFLRAIRDKDYANEVNPHINLSNGRFRWTSLHLEFIKNGE